jgi:hypothetical protein
VLSGRQKNPSIISSNRGGVRASGAGLLDKPSGYELNNKDTLNTID